MKKIIPDVTQKLDELKKLLEAKKTDATKKLEDIKSLATSQKDGVLKKLEELKKQFIKEVDKHIDTFASKKDLVQEAIKRKVELKKFKEGFFRYITPLQIKWLISAPFIYFMIVPGAIFDLFLELYHQICFRLYDIPRLKRRDYFIYDRQVLAYLNWFEKLNCYYCSYFNGLMAYAREIAARTERYWCPIKHARRVKSPHSQYDLFFEFLEGEEYRKKRQDLRCFVPEANEKQ